MNLKRIGVAFVILIQLMFPTYIVYSSHATLTQGEIYKFKTEPVDPYDIFRGRYVAVRTDQDRIELDLDHPEEFFRGQKVYLELKVDEEGYAFIDKIFSSKPKSKNFIKTKVGYVQKVIHVQVDEKKWEQEPTNIVTFNLPLNRFYMNEKKAPVAEKIYREQTREGNGNAYLKVRVRKGNALIEDLIIDGKPIKEWVSQ